MMGATSQALSPVIVKGVRKGSRWYRSMSVPPLTLAAIRQPAFLFEADGRIAEANDLAEALAGRPLGDCTAADVIAISGSAARTERRSFRPSCPRTGRSQARRRSIVPLAITASDGRAVHVLATASPLRDGERRHRRALRLAGRHRTQAGGDGD